MPKAHILVVEDNQYNQELLESQLELLGYTCELANNGIEALKCIDDQFDLIITDCHMPKMDGYEFVGKLKEIFEREDIIKRVPVIAATANASTEEQEKCRNAGMDDFISKPMTLKGLKAIVKKWQPEQVSNKKVVQCTFDNEALNKFIGEDESLHKQFLGSFLQISQSSITDLLDSLEKQDTETSQQHAHKLKSSFKTIGATP